MERKRVMSVLDWLILATGVLLFLTSLKGFLSFELGSSYFVGNRYGSLVRIFGQGVYEHDSYAKAVEQIALDTVMLFGMLPALFYDYMKCKALQKEWRLAPRRFLSMSELEDRWLKARLHLLSLFAFCAYYSFILALGRSYNHDHLLYIALYSFSTFTFALLVHDLVKKEFSYVGNHGLLVRASSVFSAAMSALILYGTLPAVMDAEFRGEIPRVIEIYTTSLENVLHLGIVLPLFLCLVPLLRKRLRLVYILLPVLLCSASYYGLWLLVLTYYRMRAKLLGSTAETILQILTGTVMMLTSIYLSIRYKEKLIVSYPQLPGESQ